jgi:hypothetical protein
MGGEVKNLVEKTAVSFFGIYTEDGGYMFF